MYVTELNRAKNSESSMSFRTVNRPDHVLNAAAVGLLCSVLLVCAACEKKAAFAPPPPTVTIAQPLRQNVTAYLELTGNTDSVNTVQLVARVEGNLDKVLFRDGEPVKKGQLLFLIEQDTYVAQLQQAQGNVETQQALLKHAKIEYARYSGLFAQKAASATDVESWRYQVDSAQAGLVTAEAQRDLAKLNLGYTHVAAPFTGRIDRRLVDPGNLVGSSGSRTVLAELRQTDPLYVYFNLSEADAARIMARLSQVELQGRRAKYPVSMGLANEEGYPHEGYLDFSATSVSTGTGTLLVRGIFLNPDAKMLPGQFARIRVPVKEEISALLVPKVAVSYDQLGAYLLLVNEKNIVERRNVKTGASKDEMYVIEEGLKGNEWVIVKGVLKAFPGRPVTPERETLQGPPTGGESHTNPNQG
jgi:RND family efflux transporter MFP subunit